MQVEYEKGAQIDGTSTGVILSQEAPATFESSFQEAKKSNRLVGLEALIGFKDSTHAKNQTLPTRKKPGNPAHPVRMPKGFVSGVSVKWMRMAFTGQLIISISMKIEI